VLPISASRRHPTHHRDSYSSDFDFDFSSRLVARIELLRTGSVPERLLLVDSLSWSCLALASLGLEVRIYLYSQNIVQSVKGRMLEHRCRNAAAMFTKHQSLLVHGLCMEEGHYSDALIAERGE
jgi:hypothetical protein